MASPLLRLIAAAILLFSTALPLHAQPLRELDWLDLLTDADREAIAASDVLLLQLEIPVPVVLDAARAAHAGGTTVMLNPSPVRALPAELWSLVDVAVVNRTEADLLADRG